MADKLDILEKNWAKRSKLIKEQMNCTRTNSNMIKLRKLVKRHISALKKIGELRNA